MNLIQRGLIGLVHGYRYFLSPSLGSACRFSPTCSEYALQALAQRGAVVGSVLTIRRLLCCNPWCSGGVDPLEPKQRSLFTALISKEKTKP